MNCCSMKKSSKNWTKCGGTGLYCLRLGPHLYPDFQSNEAAEACNAAKGAAGATRDFFHGRTRAYFRGPHQQRQTKLAGPRGRQRDRHQSCQGSLRVVNDTLRRVQKARIDAEPIHLATPLDLPPAPIADRCRMKSATGSPSFTNRAEGKTDAIRKRPPRVSWASLMSPISATASIWSSGRGSTRCPIMRWPAGSAISCGRACRTPNCWHHAAAGELHRAGSMVAQARRMLQGPRSPGAGDRVCRQLARFPPLRGAQRRRSRAISKLHERIAPGDVRGADALFRRCLSANRSVLDFCTATIRSSMRCWRSIMECRNSP